MTQRIKGQEVEVIYTGPNGLIEGFENIQSFEAEPQFETSSEGYLGFTTNLRDEIFNGFRGRMESHMRSVAYFDFLRAIKDRAQRRAPAGEVYNAAVTLNFPDGEQRRVVYQDLSFSAQPFNVASRSDFVQVTVEWECPDALIIN